MVNLLLDLPPELRVRIYEELDLLVDDRKVVFLNLRALITTTPAVFQVNRQLRHEARACFRSNIVWHIFIQAYGDLIAGIYPPVIKALRSLGETDGLWRIQKFRLVYIIRPNPLFGVAASSFYVRGNEEPAEMEVLCHLLSEIPLLRSVEIKWNDHCPERTWELKREIFLDPLVTLSRSQKIAIMRPPATLPPMNHDDTISTTEVKLMQCIEDVTGVKPSLRHEGPSHSGSSSPLPRRRGLIE